MDAADTGTLAELCCAHPPSLSRIVPRLEARDLVARQLPVTDKRQLRAALTPEGQRVTARLRTAMRAALGELKARSASPGCSG